MPIVRRESRNRVGVVWFDNEAEADKHDRELPLIYGPDALLDASIGFIQTGRDKGLDRPGEYAVVTP